MLRTYGGHLAQVLPKRRLDRVHGPSPLHLILTDVANVLLRLLYLKIAVCAALHRVSRNGPFHEKAMNTTKKARQKRVKGWRNWESQGGPKGPKMPKLKEERRADGSSGYNEANDEHGDHYKKDWR